MKESMISYELLVKAYDFYFNRGYKCINVPLVVSKESLHHTLPKNVLVDRQPLHDSENGYVASAEQSFIELYMNGKLGSGKYFAITPCFRNEPVLDLIHYTIFIKVELICIPVGELYNYHGNSLDDDAYDFFIENGIKPRYVDTPEGIDLEYKGIELGSYGKRFMPDGRAYFYGTGLAEPRFSYALSLKEK